MLGSACLASESGRGGGRIFRTLLSELGYIGKDFVAFSVSAAVGADNVFVLDPRAFSAFLLYRVCGVPGAGAAEGSGSCSLNTFRNAELLCLYTFLGRRY